MTKRKAITVRGTTYNSLTEAAKALGVTGATIHKHLKRYGHLDHIGQQESGVGTPIETTIDDFTFKSIKAAATALDIDAGTLRIYLSEKASQRQKKTLQLKVENYRLKNKLKPAQKKSDASVKHKKFKFDVSGRIEGIGTRTHRITAPTGSPHQQPIWQWSGFPYLTKRAPPQTCTQPLLRGMHSDPLQRHATSETSRHPVQRPTVSKVRCHTQRLSRSTVQCNSSSPIPARSLQHPITPRPKHRRVRRNQIPSPPHNIRCMGRTYRNTEPLKGSPK